ncbi:MAG: hypothetical protein AAGK32_13340, partial [Actinomycetota bacterium]
MTTRPRGAPPQTRIGRHVRPAALALLTTAVLAAGACGSDDAEPAANSEFTMPSTTTTTTSTPADPDSGPSFGTVDTELAMEMAQSDDDGPFFMVNLIEFRDQAVYSDGRETDLTGEEANDLYNAGAVQVLIGGGMRPALAGEVGDDQSSPPEPEWDQVAIARYPSYADFFALTGDPAFQEGSENKDAGVGTSTVIVTHRVVDAPAAAELPAGEAPVVLFELFSHAGDGTADRPDSLTEDLVGAEGDAVVRRRQR